MSTCFVTEISSQQGPMVMIPQKAQLLTIRVVYINFERNLSWGTREMLKIKKVLHSVISCYDILSQKLCHNRVKSHDAQKAYLTPLRVVSMKFNRNVSRGGGDMLRQ